MSEQDSIKARVMSNVRQLLKKERIELRSPESTGDEPEVAVEPGDAPLAVDSPNTVQQDQKGSRNAQAIVILEKLGPWMMIMSFALGITVCALAMIFYFGPTYVEAKINEAVAESESRTRIGVAQDVADAKAVAHAAETHGRLALANVDRVEVELNKQGIKVNLH